MHPDSLVDAPLSTAFREKQKAVEAIRLLRRPPTMRRNTLAKEPCAATKTANYSVVFPAFLALAHLALIAAESAALAAAEKCFLAFFAGLTDGAVPLIFAHLAC